MMEEQTETSAPETSAPETSAPETSAPETSAPATEPATVPPALNLKPADPEFVTAATEYTIFAKGGIVLYTPTPNDGFVGNDLIGVITKLSDDDEHRANLHLILDPDENPSGYTPFVPQRSYSPTPEPGTWRHSDPIFAPKA